jgi:hypothetical protein
MGHGGAHVARGMVLAQGRHGIERDAHRAIAIGMHVGIEPQRGDAIEQRGQHRRRK